MVESKEYLKSDLDDFGIIYDTVVPYFDGFDVKLEFFNEIRGFEYDQVWIPQSSSKIRISVPKIVNWKVVYNGNDFEMNDITSSFIERSSGRSCNIFIHHSNRILTCSESKIFDELLEDLRSRFPYRYIRISGSRPSDKFYSFHCKCISIPLP